MKILFVCLGNICRSPIADGIATKLSNEQNLGYEIDSAGTGSWHIGEAPCENSIKVAKLNGVDISKLKARQVTKKDFKEFDIIVALDEQNKKDLEAINPNQKKILKLGEFGFDGADVPDPYFFNGFEGFDRVYNMIDVCVKNLFRALQS